MAKKTTVDQQGVADDLRKAQVADGGSERSRSKGSGAVDEALEKGRPDRKPAAPGGLANLAAEIPKIRAYAQEVLAELKKVQWPGQKQVRAEVTTVVVTVVILTGAVYGMDRLFSYLSNLIFK